MAHGIAHGSGILRGRIRNSQNHNKKTMKNHNFGAPTAESYRIHQNPSESTGIHTESIRIHSESISIHQNPSESIGIHTESIRIHPNPSESTQNPYRILTDHHPDIHRILPGSIRNHTESIQNPRESIQNPSESTQNPSESIQNGIHTESIRIHRNPSESIQNPYKSIHIIQNLCY